MKPPFRAGAIVGFIAGAALSGFTFLLLKPRPVPEAPRPAAAPAAQDLSEGLQEENRRLKAQVTLLQGARSAAPPVATVAEKPAPPPPDLKSRLAKLVEAGLASFQSPEFAETLKALKESGRPGVDLLMHALRTSASATERFVAAALLEGMADPSAVPALAEALKSDPDDIVRRMASHALAVLVAPEAEAPLRAAATGDSDAGVRLNAAYGLAKLRQDDGLRILQGGYESPDTPSEYRYAILGGLADVAAPSTGPLFRRILADTNEAGYLLLAIHALEKMKDVSALPALEQVAVSAQPDVVKQAAAKAAVSIRK